MIRDFECVVAALSKERGVTTGRMFGSAGLKRSGRTFAMEVKGSLVVKLDAERAAALCAAGLAVPFDPGHGRVMKQWVAVPASAAVDWLEIAREALRFAGR